MCVSKGSTTREGSRNSLDTFNRDSTRSTIKCDATTAREKKGLQSVGETEDVSQIRSSRMTGNRDGEAKEREQKPAGLNKEAT